MTLDALKLGQVVMSTQGRDAGRLFNVVEVVDENYVLICDGALRKIDKPKKKKVKHLNPKQECISSLGGKLESGVKIFDAEIRKALAPLRDQGLDAPCKEVE